MLVKISGAASDEWLAPSRRLDSVAYPQYLHCIIETGSMTLMSLRPQVSERNHIFLDPFARGAGEFFFLQFVCLTLLCHVFAIIYMLSCA